MELDRMSGETEQAIRDFLGSLSIDEEYRTYFEQLMVAITKLADSNLSELDVKIMTNALKEMRYAFEVFRKYDDRRKIAVFGSARTDPDHENYRAAQEFSREAADRNYMIISGAGPGIMEAANKGAGRDDSFGLHISLPHEYQPNRYIAGDEKCITFRYFFSRKLLFAKESEAVVYFPGGFGTHDELYELLCLLQTGEHHMSPLVLCDQNGFWKDFQQYLEDTLIAEGTISEEDLQLLDYVTEPEAALDVVENFYSNYHSSRFLNEDFLIRFREFPEGACLEELEEEFIHLCPESGFRVEKGRLPGEEPDAPEELYRLVFFYTNHNYAELRRLIDYVNNWTGE